MAEKKESFTTRQASAIAGIPYRTIDHWARTSLIVPSIEEAHGTGTERRYSFNDLVSLRVARELRTAGVSMKSLQEAVRYLRDKKNFQNPLSETRLVIAGSDVLLVEKCDQLMSVLDKPGQGVFVFMVNLKKTRIEVRKKVEQLHAA